MKKSFSLLITIFILSIFSILLPKILSYKNIISNNTTQEYLYTYANFELQFYTSLIKEASSINNNSKIEFPHDTFKIFANIKTVDDTKKAYTIDLFVKSKENNPFSISLHKRFLKIIN